MKKSVYPITRIEGHGEIEFVFGEDGSLRDARLHIGSFRGFEKILVGRPIEEVPRIVTRICGLCPWAHHLAAIKAMEEALGISLPARVAHLRRLSHHLAHIQDKILHFFLLSLPDLLGLELGRPIDGLQGLIHLEPGLIKKILEAKRLCHESLELLGGKSIHPVSMVIGGHLNPPDKDSLKSVRRTVKKLLDFSLTAIEMAKKRFFYPLRPQLLSIPFQETGFLGMIGGTGRYLELYDGRLRFLSPQGDAVEFHPREYESHLVEECCDWSYSRLVKSRDWQDAHGGHGIYRVNALARLLVSNGPPTPRAREEYEEFKETLGPEAWHPMNYHWARLVEMVYCCEDALDLLDRENLTSGPHITKDAITHERFQGTRSGIGCVEAPRGTLIHHYEIDENGLIKKANLIVGTTHNIAPISEDVSAVARATSLKKGDDLSDLKKKVFMIIRAHDP